jgi:hypothetical protein
MKKKNELAVNEVDKHLKVVEQSLKDKISEFAKYEDSSGEKSKGAKGLAMTINKRVKLHFGIPREEYTASDVELLVALQSRIMATIDAGVSKGITRRSIKDSIYSTIEKFSNIRSDGFC